MLTEVIREFGPSSETNGLLGRVYKDRWEEARRPDAAWRPRGYAQARDRQLSAAASRPTGATPIPASTR